MPWPDRSSVDAAIMGKLQADAALMGLLPDGVFWDLAPQGMQRFVIVSLADDAASLALNNADGFEWPIYQCKAVASVTGGSTMKDAARRIHELLHHGDLDLSASGGYTLMVMHRVRYVRYTEVDQVDKALRWQHRGGLYEVMLT